MQHDSVCQSLTINDCFHIQTGAEIEDRSCNGGAACGLSSGIVVEEGSCNTSDEGGYAMCALAPGAHIGKESCLTAYGEVLFKISIFDQFIVFISQFFLVLSIITQSLHQAGW